MGAGSFRARTIASLVEEFENIDVVRKMERETLCVRQLVREFWEFMTDRSGKLLGDIPMEGRPRSGFVICGYPGADYFPEEYAAMVPTEQPTRLRPPVNNEPDFGANWFGRSDAIVRFHHGRDDRLFDLLQKSGVEPERLQELRETIGQQLQYQVLFQAMPLGDAIDYAKFLVQMTIYRFRFVMGAEICGGAIDIATITRKDGFSWVQRKRRIADAR